MKCIRVSTIWLVNQNVPGSKIIKGFLINKLIKSKYYCLHVWIEYENEIYDIGNVHNIRTIPILHLLGPPRYTIEEPIHLENKPITIKKFLYS